jgi:hypothetical protein
MRACVVLIAWHIVIHNLIPMTMFLSQESDTMKVRPVLLVMCVGIAAIMSSCVELPDDGQPVPDYTSQYRFVYLDPSYSTITVSMASGPTFASFVDLPSGVFGQSSAYTTFPAGSKRMFIKVGGVLVDPDTSSLSFLTDERGTVFVVPRDAVNGLRFVRAGERYTFGSVGIADSAIVRFSNCVAGGDTVDVWRLRPGSPPSLVADNLRFGRLSTFSRVPRDSSWGFYITRYNSATAVLSDTLSITGVSGKQYSVAVFDSLSRLQIQAFEDQ